jgi:hypothetical protein
MNYTTSSDDRTVSLCKAFGGEAAECAEIVERLDSLITQLGERIAELESQIKDLNLEIKEALDNQE